MKKEDGYACGLTPGLRLLRAAQRSGGKELTFYGFTEDNCKLPKEQVLAFSGACVKAAEMIARENTELFVRGNTDSSSFPADLLPYAGRRRPDGYTEGKLRVNLLTAYGWEWPMKNGWASRDIPRIELVIRWGGMCRLSGFLPIQTVYSDLYIVKDLWPDFQEQQFTDALRWYQRQDFTLGG